MAHARLLPRLFIVKNNCKYFSKSQSHIATDSPSVSLGVDPHLRLMARYLLLFDGYGLDFVGRLL
jgi:hypothetical protein